MLGFVWEFIINILEASLFFLLFNQKLRKKSLTLFYRKQAAALFVQSFLLLLCNLAKISTFYTVLLFILFHFLLAQLFYNESAFIKLFWVFIYTAATILADALTTIIPTTCFHFDLPSLLVYGTLRVPFTLVYISILGVMVLILLCITTQTFHLTKPGKFIFILLAVFCIGMEQGILTEQLYIASHTPNSHYTIFLFIIFFLVMFLFLTLTIYVYWLGMEKEKNIILTQNIVLSQMEKKQYEQIVNSANQLRHLRHDLTNHLSTLTWFLQNEQYEKANKYIQEITQHFYGFLPAISTGNSTIDSILTNKCNIAKEKEIRLEHTIHLPGFLPLSDMEICSLLGNLFDNAIESCQKVEPSLIPFIEFQMKPYHHMLTIHITNSSDGIYKKDSKGHLASSKNDRKNELPFPEHGLGLKRVQDIVSRHGGFMELLPEEERFTVSIMLPLDTKENS